MTSPLDLDRLEQAALRAGYASDGPRFSGRRPPSRRQRKERRDQHGAVESLNGRVGFRTLYGARMAARWAGRTRSQVRAAYRADQEVRAGSPTEKHRPRAGQKS